MRVSCEPHIVPAADFARKDCDETPNAKGLIMGECGCGNTNIQLKFTGPDGVVYGIQIYPGCRECGSPAGVIIYRFDTKNDPDAAMWLEGAKDVQWNPYGTTLADGADLCIPVLDPDKLKKAMVAFSKDQTVSTNPDDDADYEPVGFVEDAVDECLHEAICETADEWLTQTRKDGK